MYKPSTSYLPYLGYVGGICILYFLLLKQGIVPAMIFAGLPALLLLGTRLFQKVYSFYFLFIINYIIMGLNRYIPLKPGITMLVLTLFLLAIILVKNLYERQQWFRSRNFLVVLWLIWFIYCLMEMFNPSALMDPWYTSITSYALYPLVCAIIIPLMFTKYKYFQWLLLLWAFLSLFAAAKGYWQKNHGFDAVELDWLFNKGGGKTHLIHTGIRYFSIYNDAANYGAGMGLAMTVFGIAGFYVRKFWLRFFYWGTALACSYGLLISGTRSDMVIPLVGLVVFLVLCRNLKTILFSGILLLACLFFLTQTEIGNNNRLIRRLRSTFDTEDASWMVRVENRDRLTPLMKEKPFGTGLGLGGGKAKRYKPHDPIAQIPTDSWFVLIWVETGIVGLILYLLIIISILLHASYKAVFKIENKELKGISLAIIGGICGIFVSGYANEVFNFPNGIIVYTLFAFLYTIQYYDKEIAEKNEVKS